MTRQRQEKNTTSSFSVITHSTRASRITELHNPRVVQISTIFLCWLVGGGIRQLTTDHPSGVTPYRQLTEWAWCSVIKTTWISYFEIGGILTSLTPAAQGTVLDFLELKTKNEKLSSLVCLVAHNKISTV